MRRQGKKDKYKITIFLLCMVAVMVGFWFLLRYFEHRIPAESMKQDFLTKADQEAWEDAEEKPKVRGEIRLSGKKYAYYDEIDTYLIMGVDRSEMADFLMLAVLNRTDRTYGFLQLDRDTMTEVNLIDETGEGEATADIQLCTAHWYGGTDEMRCENTVTAVSKMLGGLEIKGYYALDMENISALNRLIGGVELELLEDYTYLDPKMKKGKVWELSDSQAYAYVHDRFGVGDETNRSRMDRQRQYMKAMFKKVEDETRKDVNYITGLYKKMKTLTVTDMKAGVVSTAANLIKDGKGNGIHSFDGESKLGQALGDGIDHAEFYPDKESVLEKMTLLYELERE